MVQIAEQLLEECITADAATQAALFQCGIQRDQRSQASAVLSRLAPGCTEPERIVCHGSGLNLIRTPRRPDRYVG